MYLNVSVCIWTYVYVLVGVFVYASAIDIKVQVCNACTSMYCVYPVHTLYVYAYICIYACVNQC